MTVEQFERARELTYRIERLKALLADFKKDTIIDGSPCGMTRYGITKIIDGCEIRICDIQNSELELFINAIESKINVLEHEFNRL